MRVEPPTAGTPRQLGLRGDPGSHSEPLEGASAHEPGALVLIV